MQTFFWKTLAVVLAVANAAEWGYHGDNGPSNWKNEFAVCGGQKQSPINFDTNTMHYDETLTPLTLTNYAQLDANKTYKVINNGHTVTVMLDNMDFRLNGAGFANDYKAAQLHFHWGTDNERGSEHTLNGNKYSMEVHIVHYNTAMDNVSYAIDKDKGLAVLGFFFQVGDADNTAYNPILDSLSGTVLNATGISQAEGSVPSFSLESIIPSISSLDDYFRYSGSLTTPTCDESVIWTVFESTIPISNTQMNKFRQIISHTGERILDNFRPVQNLNARTVTTSDSNYPTTTTTTEQPSGSASSLALSLVALCATVFQFVL
ncbi:unnamed protein product [Owenia fusiformis]|uniref:Carbonic anhydrase n=1 Tax=Owenia fusiformis TaxID=6347 RepID=A0A8J1TLA2_OWEFU|nr:unnamed protein product [Owenia fusiformis]